MNESHGIDIYDTSAHKMFYIFFHYKPVEPLPYSHPHGSFTIMPYHGHIMLFLHDLYVQLSHKFGIISIWTILLSRWCFSPFFTFIIPWNNVELAGLTHLPPLSYVQNFFQPRKWLLVLVKDFSNWNYSFLFSVVGTMLSHLGLWINSASNNTKVSCHFSCFTKAIGWVSKYLKETLSKKTLVLCVPK
jgi:hypothetical protein